MERVLRSRLLKCKWIQRDLEIRAFCFIFFSLYSLYIIHQLFLTFTFDIIGNTFLITSSYLVVFFRQKIQIGSIYMLVGREKLEVPCARAGAICAIELKETVVSCTLCSEPFSQGFSNKVSSTEPLVRVSVQCMGTADEWDTLMLALKQLSVLDSSVRVIEQENGEIALLTAGYTLFKFGPF